MFWKLIKHEFRTMLRVLLPTLISVLGLGILTRFVVWLMGESENLAFNVLGMMIIPTMILGCFAAFILVEVFLIVRFVKSTLSSEGYLIHTLPVGVNSILCSRLFVAAICMLLTAVTVFVSLFVGFFRSEFLQSVQEFFSVFGANSGELTGLLLKWLASTALGTLCSILMFYAAFSVGYSFANHKGGLSVVFIFAFYFGMQIINGVLTLVTFTVNLTRAFSGSELTVADNTVLLTVGLNAIYCIVFYLISWLMLKKRLNLA